MKAGGPSSLTGNPDIESRLTIIAMLGKGVQYSILAMVQQHGGYNASGS